MPWIVRLTKAPTTNDFRSDYFPRKYHYKKDADALLLEVVSKGGEAVVEKATKIPKDGAPGPKSISNLFRF